MSSRSVACRLLAALTLTATLASCGAPLSEKWTGYAGGPIAGSQAPSNPEASPVEKAEPKRPNCAKVKCVALTFDDGPGSYTESLLDVLDEHDARATFFLIGKNVSKNPGSARDELARGHEIGNHTYSHQDLTKLSVAAGERELRKTDEAIKKATGESSTLVRPPYGAMPKNLKKSLKVPVALWSVDTLDWQTRDTKKTIRAAEDIKPGSIVLMHDIHASTIEAVPKILEDLAAKDYHFVTVTELIGNPKPGIGYGTGQAPKAKG
ncbi:polysaccharide deacetylase family protein [Paeniglutamicibacter gangotriensis]|uniref:Polysaccharide deacetylase n=2 Tax=Paeniglutamicibacter gangotriensis TaxID=254787 RepID=M7MVK8_9MICC|nr:polysaccharide deacetylase family protein [Paeniglutamicibacter gangotriensis]EMQ98965.1 polysaccharide deacetylase [Paeniglutamicibacter gangotriensis Lz1y]KAA0974299.1 polysaccharide deacetylase family protein [Paeniglutamicibacter gangotriensis]